MPDFEQYIVQYALPVRYGALVKSIEPGPGSEGFTVRTNDRRWRAQQVAVATGLLQRVRVPTFAAAIPKDIHQLTADDYQRPAALARGAVLVVGSGQSGAQIAEELNQAGRRVYLSAGSTGHAPRRYRGRDSCDWLNLTGFLGRTADQAGPFAGLCSPISQREVG